MTGDDYARLQAAEAAWPQASPNAVLADALVSPQDGEVGGCTDERGDHPDEDVAGAEEPSGHKGDREPRKSERAEGYSDSASDLGHR